MSTLDPHVHAYLDDRLRKGELTRGSADHIRPRLNSLSASFGSRPLTQFGDVALDRWRTSIGSLRPSSQAAYISSVRVFVRWMVRHRVLRRDPTAALNRVAVPRSVPRALQARQVAELLASQQDLRSQVILRLMVGSGLRCCEVARARIEDYDPIERTLFVRGKGSHERIVPVPELAWRYLDRYISGLGASSGPIVRSKLDPSRGLSQDTISKSVADWMVAAAVKRFPHDGVSAHALRHTCLSDVADACLDLRVVMELGGHANLATASVYQRRMGMAKLRDAVEGRRYDVA